MNADSGYHSVRRLLRAVTTLQDTAEARDAAGLSLIELVALSNGMDMNNPAVLGALEAVMDLAHRVAQDVAEVDHAQLQYAEPGIRTLQQALSPVNLQKPWSELYAEIVAKGMPALAICSLVLDTRGGEKALDSAELERIAEQARQLLADIRLDDSLPGDVRKFVESSLLALLLAIDEYRIKGSVVVENAIDATIGRAVRERRFAHRDASSRSVMRRLGTILTRVAFTVALANDLDSLPETVHDVVHGLVQVVSHDQALAAPSIPAPPGDGAVPGGT